MHRPGDAARWGIAIAIAVSLAAAGVVWLGHRNLEPPFAMDYEDCAEEAQAYSSSSLEYSQRITHCGTRFAGRRKAGGGYTYFDFLQNRTFDIAGPNPTEQERKKIDWSYMEFLGAQRREMLLSNLARAQANGEEALKRGRQDAESPLALPPKIPLPVKRPPVERARSCEGGSLSCSWARVTAAVRNAFASSPSANK